MQWGLELPPARICAFDPVLSEACEQETAEESYEGLCLSYVAVTRAKRALYVLARRLREGSHSKDFNRLLHETFGRSESVIGDPNWHRAGKKPQITRSVDDTISWVVGDRRPLPTPLLPSQASPAAINAATFFARAHARSVGSDVHKLLAKISWLDEGLPNLADLSPASAALISGFLQTNTAARLFTRPARPCSLWREKAFDVVADGQWISGIFDRVVIYRNEAGQARAAVVYDFKTDERALAEDYSTQMSLYRKSLGSLIGLPDDRDFFHVDSRAHRRRTPGKLPRRPGPNEPRLGELVREICWETHAGQFAESNRRFRKRRSDALNSRVRDDHTILGNHDDPIADIEALTGHFLVFVLW